MSSSSQNNKPTPETFDYFDLRIPCAKDQHKHRCAHCFCTEKACSYIPVCEECLIKEHRPNHDVKLVADFISYGKLELEALIKQREEFTKKRREFLMSNSSLLVTTMVELKEMTLKRFNKLQEILEKDLNTFNQDKITLKDNEFENRIKELKAALNGFDNRNEELTSDSFCAHVRAIDNELKSQKLLTEVVEEMSVFSNQYKKFVKNIPVRLREALGELEEILDEAGKGSFKK